MYTINIILYKKTLLLVSQINGLHITKLHTKEVLLMKLTFIGAAHEVAGSCHVLQVCNKILLVDCGMEQGPDLYENQALPVSPNEVDYVLLTHAHIDHSGMIPWLCKHGFTGQIFTTFATKDLCKIMLLDSAHIQEFEAEWRNRKAKRSGGALYEPIYTTQDALDATELLVPVAYDERIPICSEITIRFTDIGHLLGSAAIEVWATEENITQKLVFSGDIGNCNQPILKDPTPIQEADYVIIESTYGDRSHNVDRPDYVGEFTKILEETFQRGGNVVVPSFAVGRTQELLYFIREIKEKKLIHTCPDFEVYVDSPLAIEATKVFGQNCTSCFDDDALYYVNQGINPLVFDGLQLSITSEDSRTINFDPKPKVIISASGMCEAGRIRHHLKHNLWRKDSTILFVGYQAMGTLGRKLIEGTDSVKLFGETVEVRATIKSLKGVSGHADQQGLLTWLGRFETPIKRVFVVHGDDAVTDTFAQKITEEYGFTTFAPYSGGSVDLMTNKVLVVGNTVRIISATKEKSRKALSAYERLLSAGKKLLVVISDCHGLTNKDLAKFESQILNLIEKWSK